MTAAEPLHEGIDTTKACGIGPGMAFARSLILGQSQQSAGSAADDATPSSIGERSICFSRASNPVACQPGLERILLFPVADLILLW